MVERVVPQPVKALGVFGRGPQVGLRVRKDTRVGKQSLEYGRGPS